MKYYYYIDSAQKQQGPIEASQLPSHGCNLYTFVWTEGMSDWQQAKDVQELSMIFLNNGGNTIPSSENFNYSNRKLTSIGVETSNTYSCTEFKSEQSLSKAFMHLLYSILWFAGAGLIVWALVWFFTDSKGGRIKVIAFVAPLYCTWYGLKELGLFFKRLFNM